MDQREMKQNAGLPGIVEPFVQGFVYVFARPFGGFPRAAGSNRGVSPIAGERNCRHLCASSSSEHDVNLSTSTPLSIFSFFLALGTNTIATAPATRRQSTNRPEAGGRA